MLKRLLDLFRGPTLDRQMDAEMAFHIEMETERLVNTGLDRETARARARRSFGPVDRHQEEVRDARGYRWMEDLAHDVRFGVRSLTKNRGYAAVAILTLGLGIGANTAIFSLINGVLLKPLPYENGDRLVLIEHAAPLINRNNFGVSIQELYEYRERLKTVSGLVEFHQMSFDLLRRGDPDRVATGVVSHNFFDVLGVTPLMGRTFEDKDDDLGAAPVLVLGYDYWRSRFNGDKAVLGQTVEMNDHAHTIVGVLPPVPLYPNAVDVYMPTSACPFRAAAETRIAQNRRAFAALTVFGVLAPDRTFDEARAEIEGVARSFATAHPTVYRPDSGFQARTQPVLGALTRTARPMLMLLLGVTGLVLLIACANVANLNLARVLQRERELSLRASLGAGRARLVQQLLTESCLLSLAGGVAGIVLAWATLGALTSFVSRFTERTGDIALDFGVLSFTLAVSVATGLAFGVLPVFATRRELATSMRQSSSGASKASGRGALQSGLVVAQVGVSAALLVGAGLVLLSFQRLQNVQAGYDPGRVLKAEVFGNFTKYPDVPSLMRFYEPLLQRLREIPGAQSVAITNAVPLADLNPGQTQFLIEGQDLPAEARPQTDVNIASAGYFQTLAIPLVAGRDFTDLDARDRDPVVIINRSMTAFWAGRDPLNTRITFDGGQRWFTVVGIVGDVRQYGLDRAELAQVYIPLSQTPNGLAGSLLIRSTQDPQGLSKLVREAVHRLDPDMPVENVQTLAEVRDGYLARPREGAFLIGLFAALALAVALTGVGGVIAYSVSQRLHEFGIRLALGASRESVLRLVLGQGLRLVGLGLALGLVGSLGFARSIQQFLFDTTPYEPSIFAATAASFLVAGLFACFAPARRATAVDPQTALRAD